MRFSFLLGAMVSLTACGGPSFSSTSGAEDDATSSGGSSGSDGSGGSSGDGGSQSSASGNSNSSGGDTGSSGNSGGSSGDGGAGGSGGGVAGGSGGSSGDGGTSAGGMGGTAGSGGEVTTTTMGGTGGRTNTGTGGASGGSGGDASGGTGGSGGSPVITACPETPPASSVACEPGLTCTYGNDPRLGCRDTYSCTEEGRWLVASPDCVELNDCLDTELYDPLPSIGAACPELDEVCYTDSGIICSCGWCTDDCATELEWSCEQKNAPCPHFPPNIGQPCSGEVQCGYVPCPSPSHVEMVCDDGTWQMLAAQCPDN